MGETNVIRGFFPVRKDCLKSFDEVEKVRLPLRATKNSAGYDFFAPHTMLIYPDDKYTFWSDVKAFMQEDEYLAIVVRGSIGNKRDLIMGNTVGIDDSDYYNNPDNDGNIGICLRNMGQKKVVIEEGERIVQGIFTKFLVADNCNSDTERVGGQGHTGEK